MPYTKSNYPSTMPMNEQPNLHGEVPQMESSAPFSSNAATAGPYSVRVRAPASNARASSPSVLTELPDLSRPEADLEEIRTISYGGFAMWEKPVWRGIALGGVVIVLLAAVWFFSSRGGNDSGGVTDSAGRWQVPVPQPEAPEAPRWDSNLTSAPNSPQPAAGQQTSTAWAGWNTPSSPASFAQGETPSKSPLGFDLPPGNRWGDSVGMDASSHPTGMTPEQPYYQPATTLPVPSYAPQGVPASAPQQTAWSDPAPSQPSPSPAQQASWANAAANTLSQSQPTGGVQAPVQDGQPFTVQNPYYQSWTGTQAAAQYQAENTNASQSAAPAIGTPPSAPTWAAQSPQVSPPNMPTTYPQSTYSQANAQPYGYPAQTVYASAAADERVASRGNGGVPGPSAAGYVPAYSPNLNRPIAPSWNTNGAPNSGYPALSSEAPGWGQPADPSSPGAASGIQPQVVDPAVIRADYARTSAPIATGYPAVPNPPAPAYTPVPSGNSSPYYYPSTSGNAPAYPQTSTSTWNTYR
ncbi:MAG: hypothetical protein GYA33_02495 [Thermogutta sp.]|nr:hypothetical protein [Thermogutta sp.]